METSVMEGHYNRISEELRDAGINPAVRTFLMVIIAGEMTGASVLPPLTQQTDERAIQ